MAKKVLQIIDTPYRCTIEEQDDPAIWITLAMKGAGGEFSVLFRGSGVNYALKGQDASGLSFGGKPQTHPAELEREVSRLMEKGIDVYVVEDDAAERGLEPSEFLEGIKSVVRSGVANLYDAYDEVWHW